jgi:hypothetical protein
MKTKQITFGQVREIPENAEETRRIPFILSTGTKDRHHTILNQANWQLDNYRKNPVIGYMHNLYGDLCNAPDPDDIIAKTKSIGAIQEAGGLLVLAASAEFEPASLNLKADKIFRKIILGTLGAASVGFLEVGKGNWGPGDEAEGRDNETYRFAGQELLEWSVVNIPSNPDGVKRAMRDQTTAAISYAFRALGGKYRLSEIETMRVRDILDLLDGRDLEIREKDPEKVRKMLSSKEAQSDINSIIEKQQVEFKKNVLAFYRLDDPIENQRREMRVKLMLNKFKS